MGAVENKDFLASVLLCGIPNMVDDTTEVESVLVVSIDLVDCGLKEKFPTVESAFEAVNKLDDEVGTEPPNNEDDCEVALKRALLEDDDTGRVNRPPLGLLVARLFEPLDETAVSVLLEVDPFTGLLPLVKLAKKSNDDGCALLKPPKPLKTPCFAPSEGF